LHLAVAVFVFMRHTIQENPRETQTKNNYFGVRGAASGSKGAPGRWQAEKDGIRLRVNNRKRDKQRLHRSPRGIFGAGIRPEKRK
jgi:hypothetical protein